MLLKGILASTILTTAVVAVVTTVASSSGTVISTQKYPPTTKPKVKMPEAAPWAELALCATGLVILGRKFAKRA